LNGVITIAIAPRIASIITLGQIKSMIYTFWLQTEFKPHANNKFLRGESRIKGKTSFTVIKFL
jgi:hypothetical protein